MRPVPRACGHHPAAGIEGVTRRKGCASAAGAGGEDSLLTLMATQRQRRTLALT